MFRIWGSSFRMQFVFQNIVFPFQNAVYISVVQWPLCATILFDREPRKKFYEEQSG